MRREILGWVVVGLCLSAAVSRAAGGPRVLASVWMNSRGEGTMPDGRVYRLQDEHGMPYLLGRKANLLILDTRP